ncbi:thermonuclease family protein [candidate division KSB1 bacterium]|nr:thermonuclease family protein [candidate division KSB1 bacterium]
MNLLPASSVHLVITSPPYWQLKDYGSEQQLGFHESYESYINNLNLVWQECHRVLYPGCRLCVNIGDQFARSVYYGRYKVIPIRTEITKFCETVGFDYMGAIIWQKVTTTNTTGGATIMGSFPYPRNGILKLDYEFILLFKKPGAAPKPNLEQKTASRISKEEWNTYFSGHWNLSGVRQNGHLAMFPEELPARLIKMFSFVAETVLDPFLGSGTTTLAARNLGRNSVGYEINQEYIPKIKEKLNISQSDIEGTEYVFLNDSVNSDLEKEIEKLPYIFKDPHPLNKKIDPRQQTFGSRVDQNRTERETYYSVKEVLSPELLQLNNDWIIRLLGIKTKASKQQEAVQFLMHLTKGQKVFLKFDRQKFDENNHLLGYLYLKNKTFVNTHLLKTGLVEVALAVDFKYQEKFKKLALQNT